MSKSRKIKSQLIAAVMLITSMCNLMGSSVSAEEYREDASLFYADKYEVFALRTKQEIADKYSEALYSVEGYDNNDPSTWYAETPTLGYNIDENGNSILVPVYPYDAGRISDAASEAAVSMVNFYRWLVGGLDPIEGSMVDIEKLQVGSMVRNYTYGHDIVDMYKPDDMDMSIWDIAVRDGHNLLNIADDYSPQNSISSWMREGYKDGEYETVSHRSMLTGIRSKKFTFAHNARVTEAKLVDKHAAYTAPDPDEIPDPNAEETPFDTAVPFIAYPCPGYMPSSLIKPKETVWSFELNPKHFYIKENDEENVKITITNLDVDYSVTEGIYKKQGDCIAFVPPADVEIGGTYVNNYKVEIEGIYATETDLPAKISYTIKFFDMEAIRHTYVDSTETFRKYSIPESMMNDEGFKYICSILPDEISVRADNGRYYSVPIKSRWSVDMERNCFVTSAEAYRLPSHVSDPSALMNEIVIPFEETNPSLAPYEWLHIDNSVSAVTTTGNDVLFHGQTCNVDIDTMEIFRLVDIPDDSCVSIKMFKTNEVEGGDASITLESAKPGDSGKYISVFYNQYYIDTFNVTKCFISNSLAELTVNTQCTCTTPSSGIHTNSISLGDVNLDKAVDLLDVLLLNKYIAGSVVFTEEQIANADVCKDSVILASDADALLKYTVEAIKSIPVMP